MNSQQGDIILYQSVDGGEITVTGGIVEMDGGLQTTVYLALFGGNYGDDGSFDTNKSWWANLLDTDTALHYRSETQFLLKSIPSTSNNLRRIEAATLRDTQYLLDLSIASAVESTARIVGVNKISITMNIEADGTSSDFTFTENWEASS